MRFSTLLHVSFTAGAAASARSPTAQFPLEPNTILTPTQSLTLDSIPLLGFGTSDLDPRNASEAVSWAIQVGYRHIDCDPAYNNQDLVGQDAMIGAWRAHKIGVLTIAVLVYWTQHTCSMAIALR